MSVSSVGPGGAASIAANAPNDIVGVLVLRKAMEAENSSTAQLVASLPKLEPHKGNAIDVRA